MNRYALHLFNYSDLIYSLFSAPIPLLNSSRFYTKYPSMCLLTFASKISLPCFRYSKQSRKYTGITRSMLPLKCGNLTLPYFWVNVLGYFTCFKLKNRPNFLSKYYHKSPFRAIYPILWFDKKFFCNSRSLNITLVFDSTQ